MLPDRARALFSAFLAVAPLAPAQSVIATRSGLITYMEGTVYLGDQALESHLARFPMIPQGAEFRTAQGHAEILLTPGVFLRLGEKTAIRMLSTDLSNTKVELESGSAVVDSGEPNANTSVMLLYRTWQVRLTEKGVYRIDSNPAQLRVDQGAAEVFAGPETEPISVVQGSTLPFASVLVPERSTEVAPDALTDWANGRNQSIHADNQITSQIDEDPASRPPGADAFSYFPYLGVPYSGTAIAPYGSLGLAQPGFNSIYLPGYTYQPLLLGLVVGYRPYVYTPYRIGVSPGTGYRPFPAIGTHPPAIGGGIHPGPLTPVAPGATFGAPRPAAGHPAAPAGPRGGLHR